MHVPACSEMSRSQKILLGVATAAPIALVGYLLVRMLSMVLRVYYSGGSIQAGVVYDSFRELAAVQLVAIGLHVVLLAIYLRHAMARRAAWTSERLLLWTLLLLFLPLLAMPIYWFLHVWREDGVRSGGSVASGTVKIGG